LKDKKNIEIAIIGLGYVGLPLAVEFGKKYKTCGFDINEERVNKLNKGIDETLEVTSKEITNSKNLSFTSKLDDIDNANIFIITVPTPIDEFKKPDLKPLKSASNIVGSALKPGDIVIYESTVYPGATEEECVPILEEKSGLIFNKDFYVGYSPERINPGDRNRRVTNIVKVTSGSDKYSAKLIDDLYQSIITAGTFLASSIKVAEAAKVIENTQRDVNIALINELSIIFNKLNIDTYDVLKAAGTKWNFLEFRPGLVGGHCIGVDPYYLTHKAEKIGYTPEIILAGRRLNDSMGLYISSEIIKLMSKKDIPINNSNILVMGFTFKENCPDHRNTKVVDTINSLEEFGAKVDCYDPWVDKNSVNREYKIELIDEPKTKTYDSILLAVGHTCFEEEGVEKIRSYGKDKHVFYDLKSVFSLKDSDGRL
jgi:UDP-N-acetyl-D-galactosamine dehydrogenase